MQAFYMRLNDDGKTVAAMDVLVPKVCRRRRRSVAAAAALCRSGDALAVCAAGCSDAWALAAAPRPALSWPLCCPITAAWLHSCYAAHTAPRPPTSSSLQVGELVGGSQREDRLDVLTRRITGAHAFICPACCARGLPAPSRQACAAARSCAVDTPAGCMPAHAPVLSLARPPGCSPRRCRVWR